MALPVIAWVAIGAAIAGAGKGGGGTMVSQSNQQSQSINFNPVISVASPDSPIHQETSAEHEAKLTANQNDTPEPGGMGFDYIPSYPSADFPESNQAGILQGVDPKLMLAGVAVGGLAAVYVATQDKKGKRK